MAEPENRTSGVLDRAQLHGRDMAFRELAGNGTPVLLIHGMGSSSGTWADIPERLSAAGVRVVVIDLPGHGESSGGPGDYSLGATACTIRDLLDHLAVDRVHLIGHSLGGGIAMQFAYQFPERVDALVLESSGGLGEEAFSALRAAALPGSELAISWAVNDRTLSGAAWVGTQLGRIGITPHVLSPHALETVSWLGERDRRSAFLATLRSVMSPTGQSVSALEKLHLMEGRRVLIIWGDKDPMLPMKHGAEAHRRLPNSRFVVFPGAGHEPHLHDPQRFVDLVVQHLTPPERFSGVGP